MSTRITRGSAAKQVSSIATNQGKRSQQLSSPPATPAPANGKTRKAISKKQTLKPKDVSTTPVPATPDSISKPTPSTKKTPKKQNPKADSQGGPSQAANTGKKRKRAAPAPKAEEDPDELPHNLGKRPAANVKVEDENGEDVKPSPKKAEKEEAIEEVKEVIEGSKVADTVEEPAKKKSKTAKSYGLTPGKSPFPDWPHPTAEEAQIVHDLLLTTIPSERKPSFVQPDTIPPPRTQISGCGQVPSILDALIRTLLSAATTGKNSGMAFQGLVNRFGLETEGPGKGSVDWNAVRIAPRKDVFNAIEPGGLADSKSKNIKAILDIVHCENQERREALTKAKEAGEEFTDEKETEYQLLQTGALTLDYYHCLSTNDALYTFMEYPGIGVKTAACVALFCMQRPTFAVDTHVFRLSKYLGWVPPDESIAPGKKKPDRNSTFSHCEVMIPDGLKYGIHQLFLNHGKNCPRCRAVTGEKSPGWAEANCVIEHLVKRLGAKKGGVESLRKTPKGKKRKNEEVDEVQDEAIVDTEQQESVRGPTEAGKGKAGKNSGVDATSARKGKAAASSKGGTATKIPIPHKANKKKKSEKTVQADEDKEENLEIDDLTDIAGSEYGGGPGDD